MSKLPTIPSSDIDNFHFERELRTRGFSCIAGVDEVGRGPLAGPVVAACVTLAPDCAPSSYLDSKVLSHKKRLESSSVLTQSGARIGVGIVSHRLIDQINILQASLLAMKLAVYNHGLTGKLPDYLLVDGTFQIHLDIGQLTLTKGESRSGSIAAASIIAKVRRDAIMDNCHRLYPQYGFSTNKGYPTKEHREAICRLGPCPIHRTTFKGVKEFVI